MCETDYTRYGSQRWLRAVTAIALWECRKRYCFGSKSTRRNCAFSQPLPTLRTSTIQIPSTECSLTSSRRTRQDDSELQPDQSCRSAASISATIGAQTTAVYTAFAKPLTVKVLDSLGNDCGYAYTCEVDHSDCDGGKLYGEGYGCGHRDAGDVHLNEPIALLLL